MRILEVAIALFLAPSEAFTTSSSSLSSSDATSQQFDSLFSPLTALRVSKLRDEEFSTANDDDISEQDKALLRETKKSELVSLCDQFDLSATGTKEELLLRLRAYANSKVESERQRLKDRKRRIEEGGDQDDREKYEVINGEEEEGEDDDDDEPFVYFETKAPIPYFEDNSMKVDGDKTKKDDTNNNVFDQQRNNNKPITPGMLTAPPPPPGVEPNENGERVVTVYSTTDQNDLTGVAAAQPGSATANDPMTGPVVEPENTPWDFENNQNNPNGNQKSEASSEELEAAKEEVIELVQSLLAMTGAPGFVHNDGSDDDNEVLSSVGIFRQQKSSSLGTSSFEAPEGFVGFDPTKVPIDSLTKVSNSLRMGRGSVLQDVCREFELRAVGYDGAFGDDEKRGGGHYRQVSLVRSFLEGYRRAEVRRVARETATMLLDRLVQDGIEGLDNTLSAMTRVGDDTTREAGELNDSLLDYLNDAIRQQERKVEQILDTVKKVEELERSVEEFDGDQLENLWTVGDEDGKRIETFDPKDPKSKIALQDEYEKDHKERSLKLKKAMLPKSPQERLLLLLKLLRERVKIEAAFSQDEKARNLRVLAYCLNLNSDELRKELIVKEFGSSLDRLDSFSELVSSSIEYGESTAHQVQPNKVVTLNIPLLERILVVTKKVIDEQSWKAAAGRS
ncbi:unnamed protein product [Pseudo-nitzschia multistriata]|uniref:SAP domain-containing protein n=1 Tax=Pseudo-nitzschia multistriata TaxID=183589 RepID=A0A448Z4W0_9STRA|nr:unnamed protein product [Pseudo-nitzschia multistriata]